MDTETIDKLFLELSQFSRARTPRVIQLEEAILKAGMFIEDHISVNGQSGSLISAKRVLSAVLVGKV